MPAHPFHARTRDRTLNTDTLRFSFEEQAETFRRLDAPLYAELASRCAGEVARPGVLRDLLGNWPGMTRPVHGILMIEMVVSITLATATYQGCQPILLLSAANWDRLARVN